jgi:hypothetical protein
VLEEALAGCASAASWTVAQAAEWWQVNAGSFEKTSAGAMAEKTLVIVPRA